MINVHLSVIINPTDQWLNDFSRFFEELKALKWVNEQGEITLHNENDFEGLFSIARKHNIYLIVHS